MTKLFKERISTLHRTLIIESTEEGNVLKSATAAKLLKFVKWIVDSTTRTEIKNKINQVINHLKQYRNKEAKDMSSELTVLYTLV